MKLNYFRYPLILQSDDESSEVFLFLLIGQMMLVNLIDLFKNNWDDYLAV